MLNASTDDALSIIELSFRVIDKLVREKYGYFPPECGVVQQADEVIEELNHHFKEHVIQHDYDNEIRIFKSGVSSGINPIPVHL
jgi:hypothetical protein